MPFLGLGKTLFSSSVCYFADYDNVEILLTERLSRKKGAGSWPSQALTDLSRRYDLSHASVCENRDVEDPLYIESVLNSHFPFYDYLKANNLERFSRHFNKNINFVTHHMAHAYAASFMSPFDKAIILVIDGAGSRTKAFEKAHPEYEFIGCLTDSAEERSVYLFESGKINPVEKKMQSFVKSEKHSEHYFSEGLGTFYEKASEYIFNSKRSAGKVMGLAALGAPQSILDSRKYLEDLNWSLRYQGSSKKDWEKSPQFKIYCDIAANVQNYFEEDYISYIKSLRAKYPDYQNLIIAGGCALNCTTNMKLYNLKLFDNIYISPFPGDESIGLGTAFMAYMNATNNWQLNSYEKQHGFLGSKTSQPTESEILKLFQNHEIVKPQSIAQHAAEILAAGHVIGWFQGRSESGPRALGNRSILCRPDRPGIKDYLNSHIKFRESFRPYGCSTLFEKSHLYFDVPENFNNPYMSFATAVKPEFTSLLKDVTHIDGTSRMQTVRSTQNKLFYNLIESFGKITNLFVLLNTSLNVMGEPIVETLSDAKNFLDSTPVYGLAAGDFFIRRK